MKRVVLSISAGNTLAVSPAFFQASYRRARGGASLVMVLVITAAMTVVVMVFAKVVKNEMRISRGYSNVLRADLAAKAGAAEAESILMNLFHDHPDSVTYWDPQMGASATPGTVFMYRDLSPDKEYPGSTVNVPKVYARPLISGATEQLFFDQSQPGVNNFDQALTADQVGTANSIDFNTVQTAAKTSPFNGSANGWIGKFPGKDASGNALPQAVQVPWVEVKDAAGTVRARYAWYVEDESFKLNVNTAKAAERGALGSETDQTGKTTPRPTFLGLFSAQDANNQPVSSDPATLASAIASLRDKLNATGGRFLSPLQIAHVDRSLVPNDTTAQTFGQDYKFYLTTVSSGLNLSRTGAKRLNLNKVVTNKDPSSPGAAQEIRDALDRIIAAIKVQAPHFGERFYRTGVGSMSTVKSLAGSSSSPGTTGKNALQVMPTAPQDTTPSPKKLATISSAGVISGENHREIYLTKIAANIHDYISPSPNPTVVRMDGSIMIGVLPDAWVPFSASDSSNVVFPGHNAADVDGALNPIAAVGKKAVPYFQEYVIHAKMKNLIPVYSPNPPPAPTPADYDVVIDHYFGFWNMTGKNITVAMLGTAPFIALEDQPFIDASGNKNDPQLLTNKIDYPLPKNGDCIPPSGKCEDRDFEIPLDAIPGLVFRAGQFTVITTDPDYAANGVNLGLGANVFVASTINKKRRKSTDLPVPMPREYQGKTYNASGDSGNPYRLNILGRTANPGNIDYRTKVILGNAYGVLEGYPAIHIDRGDSKGSHPIAIDLDDGSRGVWTLNFFRGSYLGRLNSLVPPDPRSNMEPLRYDYMGTGAASPGLSSLTPNGMGDNGSIADFVKSTLGNFTPAEDPSKFWQSDSSTKTADAAHAPMVIAMAKIQSIGELGNIFDPIRFGTSAVTTTGDVYAAMTGGRTLTIGQPDILWDGYGITRNATNPEMKFQVSRSRGWVAWRLCDIFSIGDDNSTPPTDDPTRQKDAFTQPGLEIDGLYNPNGILRDGGRTLRALLEGISFSDDPNLAGATLSTSGTEQILDEAARLNPRPSAMGTGGQALANYLAVRLTRTITQVANPSFSPLWERGELSQFYMFDPGNGTVSANTGTDSLISAGAATSALNDRGREELFRRLAELITMKGNTFSIYVVGQAMDKLGTTPISTRARRVLVRLHPVFNTPPNDSFTPTTDNDITGRFHPPDAYRLEVLGVEEGT